MRVFGKVREQQRVRSGSLAGKKIPVHAIIINKYGGMTSPKGQAYRRCEPREWHLPQPKKDYCSSMASMGQLLAQEPHWAQTSWLIS